jgi:predicted transglutaminase-like cysteine proteinase
MCKQNGFQAALAAITEVLRPSCAKAAFAAIVLAAGLCSSQSALAFNLGYSRGLGTGLERIQFNEPALAPFAYTRHCVQYPAECQVRRMAFRGGKLALTERRWADLVAVNTQVNHSIKPERNLAGVAGEEWLIAPKAGDCNDYAVTKRHELIARGWPSRALLLAEVVIPSGEHHLVVVVRTNEGDLVIDNLNANVRPWSKTQYRWVRIQTPRAPMMWATVGKVSA